MSNDNNTQRCGACGRELPSRDLARYGIPHKNVRDIENSIGELQRELEEEDD